MNFDFSDDMKALREQARRYLAGKSPTTAARRSLEGAETYDRALWSGLAEQGWLGVAVPEEFGGSGAGYEALCILAEEIGRSVAAVPFTSSVILATEALVMAGTEAQKSEYLPKLASGAMVGTFALAEGPGNPDAKLLKATVRNGRLSGSKWPVSDGSIADFAIVAANSADGTPGLHLAALTGDGVTRSTIQTIDPARDHAKIVFDSAACEPLGSGGQGWSAIRRLLDRAAIPLAFEQLGGADACLGQAVAYAKERYAFGRPIGSFQAIKHKLADVYVANELARANAYYGAWALATNSPEIGLAACSARVAATDAYYLASKENIQTHGGMGFTWAADCHLFYRRAKSLGLVIGSQPHWKDRLIGELETRNARAGA